MKRWLLGLLATIVSLLVAVTLIGLFLPRNHRVASRITLRAPVDSIRAVIRDISATPRWWPDMRSATAAQYDEAHENWGGEAWDEDFGQFKSRTVITFDSAHAAMTSTLGTDQGFGGSWTYTVNPVANGSVVTVTEIGWISNLVFRSLSRLGDFHEGIDSYLGALGHRFGETVTPEHVE